MATVVRRTGTASRVGGVLSLNGAPHPPQEPAPSCLLDADMGLIAEGWLAYSLTKNSASRSPSVTEPVTGCPLLARVS